MSTGQCIRPPVKVISYLTASYSGTGSLVNVPGLVVTVPETGYYDLASFFTVAVSNSSIMVLGIAISGTILPETYMTFNESTGILSPASFLRKALYLTLGSVISIQAKTSSGTVSIIYGAGVSTGFLEIVKVS